MTKWEMDKRDTGELVDEMACALEQYDSAQPDEMMLIRAAQMMRRLVRELGRSVYETEDAA